MTPQPLDPAVAELEPEPESGSASKAARTPAGRQGRPRGTTEPPAPEPRRRPSTSRREPGRYSGTAARQRYLAHGEDAPHLEEITFLPRKGRRADLRGRYGLYVELGLVASLLLLIVLFRAPIQPDQEEFSVALVEQEVVQMEEVKQTKQIEQPPPPPRPPVPVEVPNDAVMEDVALDLDASLDLDDPMSDMPLPPPPPPDDNAAEPEEEEIFVVVEQMPSIIGGTSRLYELLEYPEIARQAGVEGLVVVQVVVSPDGTPREAAVIRSASHILDEAAVAAVMQLTFEPGMQRGRAVPVRMAVPIRFRLRDAKQ